MARRNSPGSRTKGNPRSTTANRGGAWLGNDLGDEDWDEVLLQAYEHLKSRLRSIEEKIQLLEVEREELLNRLAGAEAFLGLGRERDFSLPKKPKPQPVLYASKHVNERARPKERKRGSLWNDIEVVMGGQGPLKASDIIETLIDQGYDDSDASKTRIYNSLGRWAREGKLEKLGRGVYELS